MSFSAAIGQVMWILGCVLSGSLVVQLYIHNQPVFGTLALVVALLLIIGASLKENY